MEIRIEGTESHPSSQRESAEEKVTDTTERNSRFEASRPLPSSLGGCLPNLLLSEALWEQGEGANGSSTQNGRVMGTQSLC